MNLHFYIIDNDNLSRLAYDLVLKNFDTEIEVTGFNDTKIALNDLIANCWSRDGMPDVLLLDLQMPDESGWKFLDELAIIQANLPHPIPVYLISSSMDKADIEKGLNHPFVKKYIQKSVANEQLKDFLQELISENITTGLSQAV